MITVDNNLFSKYVTRRNIFFWCIIELLYVLCLLLFLVLLSSHSPCKSSKPSLSLTIIDYYCFLVFCGHLWSIFVDLICLTGFSPPKWSFANVEGFIVVYI